MMQLEERIISRRINFKNEIPPIEDMDAWIENQKEIEKTSAVEAVMVEVVVHALQRGLLIKDIMLTVDEENVCFVDEETIEFTFTIIWEWETKTTGKREEQCQKMN